MSVSRSEPTKNVGSGFKVEAPGWIVVFLLVWLPLASFGSANNFLLIVFILTVGLIIVSHRMAKANINSVRLARRFPEDVFADTPFPIHYLVVSDHRPWGAMTLTFKEQSPLTGPSEGVFVARAPQNESVEIPAMATIAARGEHRIAQGTLASSFPFGLATYRRQCGSARSVVVFPRIDPIVEDMPVHFGGLRRGPERTDPFGTVPYHFREYVSGDPYKHIEWKKTARTGRLITKVFSEHGAGEITIRLPAQASERAISRAASLIVHFSRQGAPIALEGPGVTVEAGTGKEFVRNLLTILAKWEDRPHEAAGENHHRGTVVDVDRAGNYLWNQSGETGTHAINSRE
jgi:uncharacterized protein (DUF58 family)